MIYLLKWWEMEIKMKFKFISRKKIVFLLITMMSILFSSISCISTTPSLSFGEETNIPLTDFIIQPLEGFKVNESETSIFIRQFPRNYSVHNPTFEAYGVRFEDKQSQEDWDLWMEKIFSGPSLGNVTQIEINGVSTTIANYEGDGSEEITLTWVAVVTAEDQSMHFRVMSSPSATAETGELFKAMLETVKLK